MLHLHFLRSWVLILFWFSGLMFVLPLICKAANPIHGARQAGMGTAFTAIADDPSAMVMNPAGLTQLQKGTLYSGITALSPSTTYESPFGSEETTESQLFFPPHMYVVSKFGTERMSFGVGIYSLFGVGGQKWSDQGLTRFISLKNYIATMAVNPTVAWQINQDLSLGVGLYYLYSKTEAVKKTDQSTVGGAEGEFEIEADGGGWGYNLGILYRASESWRIGAGYRSPVDIEHNGTATLSRIAPALQANFGGSRYKTPLRTWADFPEIVNLGLAYCPNQKLTIGVEVEWMGWSRFDTSRLDFKNEVPSAGFTDISMPLDWNDSWLYKIGAEYKIGDHHALRTGYAFVESPVPSKTLSPSAPNADSHNISLGYGWQGGRYSLDAFYMIQLFERISVNNPILSGSYDAFSHFVGLSMGYAF